MDTPGLNDPIPSRTIRTKEFMELCDVVFFLSQAGSFLDRVIGIYYQVSFHRRGLKNLF